MEITKMFWSKVIIPTNDPELINKKDALVEIIKTTLINGGASDVTFKDHFNIVVDDTPYILEYDPSIENNNGLIVNLKPDNIKRGS